MGSQKKRKHDHETHSSPHPPHRRSAPLPPSAPLSSPRAIKAEPVTDKLTLPSPPSAALPSPRAPKAEAAKAKLPPPPPSASLPPPPTPPTPQAKPVKAKLPEVKPQAGTPLAQVMAVNKKRHAYWRSDDMAQVQKNQVMLNSGRKDYELSAYVTTRGEDRGPCQNCLIRNGKFTKCVAIQGVHDGACGNCIWGGEHLNCSNVSKYLAGPFFEFGHF
jgi:hypothetical protein